MLNPSSNFTVRKVIIFSLRPLSLGTIISVTCARYGDVPRQKRVIEQEEKNELVAEIWGARVRKGESSTVASMVFKFFTLRGLRDLSAKVWVPTREKTRGIFRTGNKKARDDPIIMKIWSVFNISSINWIFRGIFLDVFWRNKHVTIMWKHELISDPEC